MKLKIFLIALFCQLIVTYFGINPLNFWANFIPLRPAPEGSVQPSSRRDIEQKLSAVPNTFKIKNERSLIAKTSAGDRYSQAPSYIVVDMNSGEALQEEGARHRKGERNLV